MVLMLVLLASATWFYREVEGWGIVDSLYFCVMTMSTIGYGDLTPSTPFSKIFTIMFSILSIGVFAAVASKIVVAILERRHHVSSGRRHDTKANESKK